MKEIEFDCPNCQQSFRSSTYVDGAQCACVKCGFEFTVLAKVTANGNGERISAPDPELSRARRFAKLLATRVDVSKPERSPEQTLLDSASNADGTANFFFVIAIISFGIAMVLLSRSDGHDGAAAGIAACGGFLSLGIGFKIIAQLIYIRAELRSKNDQ